MNPASGPAAMARASSSAALASSYLPNGHSVRGAIGLVPSHADSCAERLVDPIALGEMREGLGVDLLVVAEQDADAGMRRRQSRRVAGLLRQFELLGKAFMATAYSPLSRYARPSRIRALDVSVR